jgi:hypothetical protein
LTLCWFLLIFINIDDSPFLMDLSAIWFHGDVSTFIVKS